MNFSSPNEKEKIQKERILLSYREIYKYLGKFRLSEMDREDVLQNVFLVALLKYDALKDENKTEAWLKKIAEHAAIQELRKKKRELVASDDMEGMDESIPRGTNVLEDALDILLQQERQQEVRELIDRIGAKYSLIVKMHYLGDLSLIEIARLMDLNYNTVKTLHVRALKLLLEETRRMKE